MSDLIQTFLNYGLSPQAARAISDAIESQVGVGSGEQGPQGEQGEIGPQGDPGSEPINVATVTISAVEINNLHDAPVEIVAAPGADKALVVVSVAAAVQFVSAAYDTNTDLHVWYEGLEYNLIGTSSTNILAADGTGGGVFVQGVGFRSDGIPTLDLIVNKALVVTVPGGNPDNGDSTVKVTVLYYVVDLA